MSAGTAEAGTATDEVHLPFRWRLLVVGGLVATVAWMARDLWFFDDDWDYLTERTGGDPGSYLEDHAAHWTLWTVPVFRVLYALVGVDYFPWYHIPRFAACATLALVLWWAYARRGAIPAAALAGAATFAVLDASAGHRAVSIGNYIVVAALVVVAIRLAENEVPDPRDRLVVGGALLVAVMAFSTGPMLVAATALVVLANRRLRSWWTSLLPAVLVYGAWTIFYGPERGAGGRGLLALLPAALEVLSQAMASLLQVPLVAGGILAGAALVVVVVLARRRELDCFDALCLTFLGVFVASAAALRGASEVPIVDRYAFVPLVSLSLVLVPRIRRPERRATGLLLLALAVTVPALNLAGTYERSEELAEVASSRRELVETAGALLAAGEPAVDDSWVTVPLTVDGLRRLVDGGWTPSAWPGRMVAARGVLRIGLGPGSALDQPVEELGDECAPLPAGRSRIFAISDAATLLIRSAPPTRVEVRWAERSQIAERTIRWGTNRGSFRGTDGRFDLARPAQRASIAVTTLPGRGAAATVCAPAPSGG